MTDDSLEVTFPKSAIMYLTNSSTVPDTFHIKINVPDNSVTYDVPAVKVTSYTLDAIVRKRLFFLFPFYILRYESMFERIDHDTKLLKDIRYEYSYMLNYMEELCEIDYFDEYTKRLICEMSMYIVNHVTSKYSNIKKEVSSVMGGVILDYEAKEICVQIRT